MIQIISVLPKASYIDNEKFHYNDFKNLDALDDFELNIFDLSHPNLWQNSADAITSINSNLDFKCIRIMISLSKVSKKLFILPQNLHFKYCYYGSSFNSARELKNMTNDLCTSLLSLISPVVQFSLVFEKTKTMISDDIIASDFHFIDDFAVVVTSSKSSNKKTTILSLNNYYTTLDINVLNQQMLLNYLEFIGLIHAVEECPKWVDSFIFNDDQKIREEIVHVDEELKKKSDVKSDLVNSLKKNQRIKSILYTNGGELVSGVIEILSDIFGDGKISSVDVKKEDFTLTLDQLIIISEVKGISSNVKNSNLSQLDNHLQSYLETQSSPEMKAKCKSILIINHQRQKDIFSREPINIEQIDIALRNGSLIIETIVLLKIYENYLQKKISSDEIIGLFRTSGKLEFD